MKTIIHKGFGQTNKKFFLQASDTEVFQYESDDSGLREFLKSKASKFIASDSSGTNNISNKELSKILEDISIDRQSAPEECFSALALLAQMGATSARAQGDINVTINGTVYTAELIKKITKKITKKAFRRVAKTFATEIEAVARANNYKGNLYNKIALHYPQSQQHEKDKTWFSDFQSDNPDCPSEIRGYINRYYNENIKK